jgi:hypothetical protein
MEKRFKATVPTWIITTGEVALAGKLEPGQTLATINEIHTFEDEETWKAKKIEFGVVENTPKMREPKLLGRK